MSLRTLSAAAFAAMSLLVLPAIAGEPVTARPTLAKTVVRQDAIFGAKTTGAMRLAIGGLATDPAQVHAQGGFAIPGAVLWTAASGQTGGASMSH